MTISTSVNKAIAQGNGATTVFSYSFLMPSASNAVVTVTDNLGNQTPLTSTQYAISGIGVAGGGTITYPLSGSPLASGYSITLQRVLPLQQLTSLINQNGYYPSSVEGGLDYLEMQIQQIAASTGGNASIQFPAVDPLTLNAILPAAAARANQLLSFDALGNVSVAAPVAGTATALATALANAASATQGAGQIGAGMSLAYAAGTVGNELQQRVLFVTNIAALKALSKLAYTRVYVVGYYALGDGGGGFYYYDSTDSSSADNGGTIIVAADGGRWKLVVTTEVSLRQFGAKGDGVTNDTAALQAAFTWAYATPTHRLIDPTGGTYLNSGISVAYVSGNSAGVNFRGAGLTATVFQFTGAAGLTIQSPSGSVYNTEISGVYFTGISSTVLVELQGLCGQKLRHCRFGTGLEGLRFHNFAAGSFTEYCDADTCVWDTTCTTKVRYKFVSGNNSFNGSGLVGQNTINSTAAGGDSIVQIDNGCVVYNAPFFAQIWANNSCTVFNNSNTTAECSFYGHITLERFAGTVTLGVSAAGLEIPFAGKLNSLNEFFKFGAFFLCDMVTLNSAGNRQVTGGRWSKSQALTTGANVITGVPALMSGGLCQYLLRISGSNYDYRMHVETWDFNPNGTPVVVSTPGNFNVAGYGAPSFTINSSNQLVITNAGYPASGITLNMDVYQIGQSPDATFIG